MREVFTNGSSTPGSPTEELNTDDEESENNKIAKKPAKSSVILHNRTTKSKGQGRKGPTSTKRKLGQEAVSSHWFSSEILSNLNTTMQEVPFDAEEDMLSVPPGVSEKDMRLFKKFKIIRKDEDSRLTNPFLLHSPLFRSYTVGNPALTAIEENILPPTLFPAETDVVADVLSDQQATENSSVPLQLSTDQYATDQYSHDAVYPQLHQNQALPTDATTPNSGNPATIFAQSLKRSSGPVYSPINSSNSLFAGHTEQDFFDYFVNIVADDLVPIPFEESPFFKHLPLKASTDKVTWDLLVAFGASHKAVMKTASEELSPDDVALVESLVKRCERQLEVSLSTNSRSNHSLLGATMLAMIELDRGVAKRWWYYLDVALHVIALRPTFADWDLNNEVNSMLFRLIGFMTSMANILCGPAPKILPFPSWPQWSGSLDHLTGIDLNLLPLFSEVALLIRSSEFQISKVQALLPNNVPVSQRKLTAMTSSPSLQRIRMRSLRIFQRINDYWIDEYIPDSDITAMCILFQEALQIHLLRRVLMFPNSHPVVQRIITLGMSHLERWIPPRSRIQRNMTFILASLASEAIHLRHRTVLLIRLRNMAEAGFKYHWKLCRDLKQHWENNKSLICSRTYTLLPR